MPSATFRFYEELNDFLAAPQRKREFGHSFDGAPAVKDVVDGESVSFDLGTSRAAASIGKART